ncbi:MAG: hypothetical protein C0601_07155 [Candidatus Muiribacterium halophilum]|uniref:Outer membrane lipoprotein BamD-like domain-containing protein n=1 Tax=Muiribacterium halophilum TaxID=2053465 RepID=A0A2N5ZFN8_MUIH1|nr:MAG: hypothetical protein C0601_07155 [Candidatus Muirbacterium halophilum]
MSGKYIFVFLGLLLIITGCTNGGGDMVGSINGEKDYSVMMADAWDLYYNKHYTQAAVNFNEVQRLSPGSDHRSEAFLGMGWCYLKDNDLEKAQRWFGKVDKSSQELHIGLCSMYLAQGTQAGFENALNSLRSAGFQDTTDMYIKRYPVGITQGYCQALAAIVYYFNGKDYKASQFLKAVKNNDEVQFDYKLQRIYESMISDLKVNEL